MVGFIHLRTHSSYSLLEGAISIAKLAKLAENDSQPALGIADTNNLFGAMEFADKMVSAGIQPLIGIALGVAFMNEEKERPARHASLVLIAANEQGYQNLIALSSLAFQKSEDISDPSVSIEMLETHKEGIICLSGDSLHNAQTMETRAKVLIKIFGEHFFLELQRHGLAEELEREGRLLELSNDLQIPLVATNQPMFATKKDHLSHDALIAIAQGEVVSNENRRKVSREHYFKSRKEMMTLFADLPDALENTVIIAQKCSYWPLKRASILPRFAQGDEAAELKEQAHIGLTMRLKTIGLAPNLTEQDYRDRLDFELQVIKNMNFPGYFLIVSDFIKYAKSQHIPVGPGRGSGAGSLVAYSLTITDLDPLRFSLLFERFLNPDRVSMPDFDIDFCQERRDEVIQYVRRKYGNEQVAQIITFGSLQARGVLRDVGRVLQMPYSQVDKLCKLVPQNPTNPVTLEKAIEGEAKLQSEAREQPIVAELFEIAVKLEGLHRHASTHAAGLVIGDRPLSQLVPLYRDPKSDMPVTQFNMKWVEIAGLVKFDFLGLKTLTVLQRAVDLLKQRGIVVDLTTLPIDDEKTFALLSRGETVGVFQVESAGMRKALVEMKASTFEDIIALVALYRPGPMANIPVYCNRKLGLEEPDYLYEGLEVVLKETYGIIVYQEQVMQIAQIMGGYSLGEADLLRRAMGKKDKVEMAKQKIRFEEGSAKNNVPKKKAGEIFDLLEKFADYGFNKSHAAAYALVSYQTAYMKANYPIEFMAASCDYEISNTDKLAEFYQETKRMGLEVLPPDINRSFARFEVINGQIPYGLGALKGVGEQAAISIIRARGDKPFTSLNDFATRIESKAVNRKTLESLAQAGAFDRLESSRSAVIASIDLMINEASRLAQNASSGQTDIFGVASSGFQTPKMESWGAAKKLEEEMKAVGFYLSGHPLDDYISYFEKLSISNYAKFSRGVKAGDRAGRLAGSVISRQERRTKTGNKMGVITLSDATGQFEAVIFQEGLAQYRDLLEPGQVVMLTVAADLRGEEVSLRINTAEPLDRLISKYQKGLRIEVQTPESLQEIHRTLMKIYVDKPKSKNDREIRLIVPHSDDHFVELQLEGFFSLNPQVSSSLRGVKGVISVQDW